jgi:hypothetical protein
MSLTVGTFRAALGTLVRQGMATRYDLRNRRNSAVSQAATANHEVAQLVEQSVADVVFRDRRHSCSPSSNALFWHLTGTFTSKYGKNVQNC